MLLLKGRKFAKKMIMGVLVLSLLSSILLPARAVNAAKAEPIFKKTTQNILVGDTLTMKIANKPAGAKYKWSTGDKSIASVDQKGKVQGIGKGKTVITCKVDTKQKNYILKCTINVKESAKELIIKNKIDFLVLGKEYDLNRSLKPSTSNDITTWKSSDSSVISVNSKGVIKALKEGVATITATTLSKASDSITIYAVGKETVTITKKDVVNNKVVLKKKSYGNLIIQSNVGDAAIELNHVTVGGTLTMESGAAYTVLTNECTVNKVSAVKSKAIQSFALSDPSDTTPSLVADKNSLIVTVDSECNISVKQGDGATIQSFHLTVKQDGSIEISLEGFTGDFVIDSQANTGIKIVTTSCDMSSATIKNATPGQAIVLTDAHAGTAQASTIQRLDMQTNAALTVDINTDEVTVGNEASGAEVVISQPVGRFNNDGTNTQLKK